MNKKISLILTVAGILLIIIATIMVFFTQYSQNTAVKENERLVSVLYSLMPEVTDSATDDRVNKDMPLLEVEGMDFAGIIEIPMYKRTLPVYASWDKSKVSGLPCRYSGSIYDKNLIIGGSDGVGQFDFMKQITVGDDVHITDVTGARFTYTVSDIELTRDVSSKNLAKRDADLIFFARNTYSLDYTVVSCCLK